MKTLELRSAPPRLSAKAAASEPAGHLCPRCGHELVYPSPNVRLLVDPPRRAVQCRCGYAGSVSC